MSDPMRTLREGAKQLQKLHKDLHPPAMSRRPWKDNVFARQSLGDEVEVELWYLAEHFLLAWHDWHGLKDRFPRYYGDSEELFPAAWWRLDGDCHALASRLLRNRELDELVSNYWHRTGLQDLERMRTGMTLDMIAGAGQESGLRSLRDDYQTVVENHRRWSLMKDGVAEESPHATEAATLQGEVWPQCRQLAVRLNEEILSACQARMEVLRSDLRFHLWHYCHANLLVSWLSCPAASDDDRGHSHSRSGSRTGSYAASRSGSRRSEEVGMSESALLRMLSEKTVIPSIDQYLSRLKDPDTRGTASHVLGRITQAIGEIGYDDFVDDVSSSHFHGGPESLVGASSINLIPSEVRGPCHALLLAVSKGEKKAIGFPSIMRQVREHLIRCPATQAVIVLCDHWSPTMLDEHRGDLVAHHDRGVRFLFLMVGTPGRLLAPVAVDLGMSP